MLTVDYDRLGLTGGDRLLDLGCGAGRHAFEALRRGARVVAFDYDEGELKDVAGMAAAMAADDQIPPEGHSACARGDATRLPFPDGSFDRIIAAEVLEHIPGDETAIGELARVLRPGGSMAVTVPAWLAERVCWALTDEYHAPFVEGGHVRIYTESGLRAKLRRGAQAPGVAPRPRHPQPVLVAALCRRTDQRRASAGEALPHGAGVGHRRHAAVGPLHPAGRPRAEPGDR